MADAVDADAKEMGMLHTLHISHAAVAGVTASASKAQQLHLWPEDVS